MFGKIIKECQTVWIQIRSENMLYLLLNFFVKLRPKKKNCVVRVTAEKTLGRVGRYFFFVMANMLDDKKKAF